MALDIYNSPVGKLYIHSTGEQLKGLYFYNNNISLGEDIKEDKITLLTKRELDLYFNKELENFTVPLKFTGTEYQKLVQRELLKIPYGRTLYYSDIAKNIDSGPRAVGNAVGKNNIPIIIPCHRVINKNNRIGGYSGGIEIKKYLLELEGANFD